MAHGALLETLRIAASSFGLSSEWTLRPGSPDNAPVYDVRLRPEPGLAPDPLLPFVEKRTVQRRPMRTTPLSEAQYRSLSSAVGSGFILQYFKRLCERLAIAGGQRPYPARLPRSVRGAPQHHRMGRPFQR